MGNNRGNIVIYTSGDFPYGGAAENFVRLLALGLKANNQIVNIKLFRGGGSNQNDTGIAAKSVLFKNRQSNEFLKLVEFFLLIILIPYFLWLDKIRNNVTVVFLYGIDYFYYVFPFMVMCKILNIKLIRIAPDKYNKDTIAPIWWKLPKYYFFNLQFSYFDKYMDGMVFLSTYLYSEFIKSGGKEKRAIVIPHFIDIEQFKGAREWNTQELILAYSGSILRNNGIFDLLDAFSIVIKKRPDLKLMILGNPASLNFEDKNLYDRTITGFGGNVVFNGYVSHNEISKKLKQATILINPRRTGEWADAGFPTKLGEYLACKKIVISTEVGDIKKYFTDGTELFICRPNDPISLAEKVNHILDHLDKYKTVASVGYDWANQNLNYKNSAIKLLKFLTKDRIS